jgi:hypothetical protein
MSVSSGGMGDVNGDEMFMGKWLVISLRRADDGHVSTLSNEDIIAIGYQ